MKTTITALISSAFLLAASATAQTVNISAFPQKSVSEEGIIALAAASAEAIMPDSIGSTANVARRAIPVNVTAKDFVTKVYALFSPDHTKDELCEDCQNVLRLLPSEDNMGLWLDSADGYHLNYYGQTIPGVSAMANVENDSVTNFGFFFLFPYNDVTREEMDRRQARFCGSLLQEMQDIGAVMGVNTASDALFEASGDYNGNFVDFRLLEEATGANTGRYVLYLTVEPHAFTAADSLAAL
ncbi:MAG: hypothetical protein K2M93_09820 [Muribaculaceae bacterium]|nr:hypothetical protein [Muribaculaceae bacterium]